MTSHLLPTDIGWTEDKALMADLSRLNSQITHYILGYLIADAGQRRRDQHRRRAGLWQQLIEWASGYSIELSGAQLIPQATARSRPHNPRCWNPGNDQAPQKKENYKERKKK